MQGIAGTHLYIVLLKLSLATTAQFHVQSTTEPQHLVLVSCDQAKKIIVNRNTASYEKYQHRATIPNRSTSTPDNIKMTGHSRYFNNWKQFSQLPSNCVTITTDRTKKTNVILGILPGRMYEPCRLKVYNRIERPNW